jgi:predicted nucleotidyltransferase
MMMQEVRLPDKDLDQIKVLFKSFFNKDHLWLFGSRVNLSKKGGDIDLYIETSEPSFDILLLS